MKVSKAKSEANRAALISAAGKLFRTKGIDGVGVADISKAAGLTHGALYAQFPSKQALAAAALSQGMEQGNDSLQQLVDRATDNQSALTACLAMYFSTAHRDNFDASCAIASSMSEVARQDAEVCAQFSQGLQQMLSILESVLHEVSGSVENRDRAMLMVATMTGTLALSRALAPQDPQLADHLLATCHAQLLEFINGNTQQKGV